MQLAGFIKFCSGIVCVYLFFTFVVQKLIIMKNITIKFCLLSCFAMFVLRTKGQMNQGIINIGGSGSQSGNSIIQTGDGGYAIAGYTNSYGAGGYDVYVVKLDKSGNEQWAKTIGGVDSDAGNAIVQAND